MLCGRTAETRVLPRTDTTSDRQNLVRASSASSPRNKQRVRHRYIRLYREMTRHHPFSKRNGAKNQIIMVVPYNRHPFYFLRSCENASNKKATDLGRLGFLLCNNNSSVYFEHVHPSITAMLRTGSVF